MGQVSKLLSSLKVGPGEGWGQMEAAPTGRGIALIAIRNIKDSELTSLNEHPCFITYSLDGLFFRSQIRMIEQVVQDRRMGRTVGIRITCHEIFHHAFEAL